MSSAVRTVAAQFKLSGTTIQAATDGSSILIKIDLYEIAGDAQLTANAVKRYKAHSGQLGLPTMGTVMMVAGKEYVLVGLSSDCARVKARLNVPGGAVIDIPLVTIKSTLDLEGAKKVAALEAAEAAVPSDVIAPLTINLLASIGKKDAPKPAQGQN